MTTKTRKPRRRPPQTSPTAYLALQWRETTARDYFGDPCVEVLIANHGWCKFSNRLAAVHVEGAWRTNWEHAS